MSSDLDFVQYVVDQIAGAGHITYRKMFGEYGVYCGAKMVALVVDNQFLLKNNPPARTLLESRDSVVEVIPYVGAKPWLALEDLEDREFLAYLVSVTASTLPTPKPIIKINQKSNK